MKVSFAFPAWCFFLFFISSVFLPGTDPMMSHHPNLENEKQIVLAKDWEISKVSAVSGVLRAFYPFMTEKSILLPQTGHPVQGKETCANLISRLEMDGRENVLKWEPLFAGISAAGDLAYTHGRYELPTAVNKAGDKPGDAGKQEINYGYYGTVWKKDADGTWKVAFSQGLVLLKGLNQKPLEEQLDPVKVDGVTREVLATERAFSDYSSAVGQPAAFYHYIDDNGIALGAAGAPKTKADFGRAVEKEKKLNQPRAGKLEWKPLYSYVASSGDMAYNFGTYVYTLNSEGNAQVGRGYFLTVWKKEPGKGWKFVLDCGNKVE